MKKHVLSLITIILMLSGCSNDLKSGLVEYEKTKLNTALVEVSFNPEIPERLPYKPTKINVDTASIAGEQKNLLFVTFVIQNKGKITLSAKNRENAFNSTEETVKINDNSEGSYGQEEDSKILIWKKGKIHYELVTDIKAISKEELIQVADSFNGK